MSTITAVLEPDLDGTLHLPLPAEFRSGKVRVVATLEVLDEEPLQRTSLKTDYAAIRRKLWGNAPEKHLSPEDSAFIRDRGEA